jgi:hypothetical protein
MEKVAHQHGQLRVSGLEHTHAKPRHGGHDPRGFESTHGQPSSEARSLAQLELTTKSIVLLHIWRQLLQSPTK